MQISIESKHLRAMAHLMAKQDIRIYPNGLWIEAGRETILVATDGATLGAFACGAVIEEGADFKLFVPERVLVALKKAEGLVTFQSADGKTWTATVPRDGSSQRWVAEDLRLVDWRRVVPATTSGEAGQFNLNQLSQFTKVAAELGVKWADKLGAAVLVNHNGTSPALVQIRDHEKFVGLVSPLQGKAATYLRPNSPGWARGVAEEECELA